MSSDYDASEFVDGDFEARKTPYSAGPGSVGPRAPTQQEVDARVADAQSRLAELKRAQEQLERERASLEETRRRQIEFQTSRQEMMQNLARGLTLLEEVELNTRREADQTAKTVVDLKDALTKVQAIQEDAWTKDNFQVELTRALTTIENARMEWNAARLKYPTLSAPPAEGAQPAGEEPQETLPRIAGLSFGELCRLGFALTWPLAAVGLVLGGSLVFVLLRR
jgi:chromosome segregation ATPase